MVKKHYSLKLFLLCWLAYTSSYICRRNYSVCLTDIRADLGFDLAFAGAVSTGFMICYGVGQLINGILGDRFSPKKMVFIGLLGAGACNILMGFNRIPILVIILWCLNGYFNSMLWAPIIKCFAEWLSVDAGKKAALNISTTIPSGMIMSYLISSLCLKFSVWQTNFFIVGAWLIIAAFIWNFGITSLKSDIEISIKTRHLNNNIIKGNKPINSPSLFTLIISGGLIFAVLGIFFNGVLKDSFIEWIPTYLIESFKISPAIASATSIIFSIINLSGAYIASFFYKRLKYNEFATSTLMFFFSFLSLTILKAFNGKSIVIAVITISISIATMYGANNMLLSFIPLRFSSVGKSASVTGFLDACSYIASAVATLVFGVIVEKSGWNTILLIWVITGVVGTVVCASAIKMWKNKCKEYSGEVNG